MRHKSLHTYGSLLSFPLAERIPFLRQEDWPKLAKYLEAACTQSWSVTSSSTPPAIYGMAAAAEARFLRSSMDGDSDGKTSMPTGGQGVVLTVDNNNAAEEVSSLGDAKSSLGDAESSLGDAESSLGAG